MTETAPVLRDGESNVAALVPHQGRGALVAPAGTVEDIAQAFEDYQRVCGRLLDDNDHQSIGGKKFRKRSAWRKLAVAFGVSFEIRSREIHRDDQGRVVDAEFQVRAVAPNGRYADGWGACDVFERCCPPDCNKGGRHSHCPSAEGEACPAWTHFSHANHDIPATAETRAKNRAASDLFGMGEVSAEEITELESKHEHEQLLAELDTLMDTAESMHLEVDREKVRGHGSQSPEHARQAIRVLRGRMDEKTNEGSGAQAAAAAAGTNPEGRDASPSSGGNGGGTADVPTPADPDTTGESTTDDGQPSADNDGPSDEEVESAPGPVTPATTEGGDVPPSSPPSTTPTSDDHRGRIVYYAEVADIVEPLLDVLAVHYDIDVDGLSDDDPVVWLTACAAKIDDKRAADLAKTLSTSAGVERTKKAAEAAKGARLRARAYRHAQPGDRDGLMEMVRQEGIGYEFHAMLADRFDGAKGIGALSAEQVDALVEELGTAEGLKQLVERYGRESADG